MLYTVPFQFTPVLHYMGTQADDGLGGGIPYPVYGYSIPNDPTNATDYNAWLNWTDTRPAPSYNDIITTGYAAYVADYYSEKALRSDVLDLRGMENADKAPLVHTHAQSDVTGLVSALSGKLAASSSASTPSRTLNSNFTPNASKMVFVSYTISISCSATIAGGGQTGKVELRSDSSATPTTVRGWVANTNSVTLAVAVGVVNTQEAVLSYLVPAGEKVRLVSSGTATISIVAQSEVAIG